jgi:hypothetical protein
VGVPDPISWVGTPTTGRARRFNPAAAVAIVGFFVDDVGPGHGFLLDRGIFSTIDVPDDSGTRPTQIIGINKRGQMVGLYIVADGIVQGFLMDKKGVITLIDHPLPVTGVVVTSAPH